MPKCDLPPGYIDQDITVCYAFLYKQTILQNHGWKLMLYFKLTVSTLFIIQKDMFFIKLFLIY